jgi:Na+/H+ antiporter NhaA
MRFGLRYLFGITAIVAAYAVIPHFSHHDGGVAVMLFLVVSLVALLTLGPFQKRGVVISSLLGAVLGLILFAHLQNAEDFHPKDRMFHLLIYTGLCTGVSSLLGILIVGSRSA